MTWQNVMNKEQDAGMAPTRESLSGLTQELAALTDPAADLAAITTDHSAICVLVLTRDSKARAWAPRWISQAGLFVEMPDDTAAAMQHADALRPHIVIVDAALRDDAGEPLYLRLMALQNPSPLVFVMCANGREVVRVQEDAPHDIIRKPYDWELISRRIVNAAETVTMRERLDRRETSLHKALSFAEHARDQLRSRDSYEPVTGLPNKTKFKEVVSRGMRAVDRDGNALTVFIVGFTRFRLVVEAMGQETADMLLAQIGETLTDCLRDTSENASVNHGLRTSIVGAIDHARFGLMLTWSGEEEELQRFQNKLMQTLSLPIQVGGQTVHLSACLGVAMYPQDADGVDSLLQRADNAMRDAQSRGGGFRYHCAETDAAAARKLRIEHMLHEALDQKELRLAYQPIVRTSDQKVIAAEALLRWRRNDGTMIPPMEFIGIAEESGLMIRIGEYVLETACQQLSRWQKAGVECPVICVNVAKIQLMNGDFAPFVARTLKKYKIAPSSIELEISERGVLSGDFDIVSQLHALKASGVRLSVDDFGTGDSAIAYLKELPIDVLKIDKSYISGVTRNRKDAAITSAMVALGQRLDLMVIAEGVETTGQLEELRKLGCDACQGFLFSPAVQPVSFEKLIEDSPVLELVAIA